MTCQSFQNYWCVVVHIKIRWRWWLLVWGPIVTDNWNNVHPHGLTLGNWELNWRLIVRLFDVNYSNHLHLLWTMSRMTSTKSCIGIDKMVKNTFWYKTPVCVEERNKQFSNCGLIKLTFLSCLSLQISEVWKRFVKRVSMDPPSPNTEAQYGRCHESCFCFLMLRDGYIYLFVHVPWFFPGLSRNVNTKALFCNMPFIWLKIKFVASLSFVLFSVLKPCLLWTLLIEVHTKSHMAKHFCYTAVLRLKLSSMLLL